MTKIVNRMVTERWSKNYKNIFSKHEQNEFMLFLPIWPFHNTTDLDSLNISILIVCIYCLSKQQQAQLLLSAEVFYLTIQKVLYVFAVMVSIETELCCHYNN